jgi:hypothetical protein
MHNLGRDYGERALAAIGLQPRRSASDYILPALGLFGVGMLVGAGLGLLLAPKQGRELRGDINRGLSTAVHGVSARLRRKRTEDPTRESIDVSDVDGGEDDVLSAVQRG